MKWLASIERIDLESERAICVGIGPSKAETKLLFAGSLPAMNGFIAECIGVCWGRSVIQAQSLMGLLGEGRYKAAI
jgi:hypothetical protein